MQRLIGQAADGNDFTARAQALCGHTPQDNTLYAQAVRVVADNGPQIAAQNADLLGTGYTFCHEVPVWQFNKDTGLLVKGSIDTLAVGEERAVILEYKVLFNNNYAQRTQAEKQMQEYENMLRALGRDYPLEKRAVELSEKKP